MSNTYHTAVALGNEFAIGRVIDHVFKVGERLLGFGSSVTVNAIDTIGVPIDAVGIALRLECTLRVLFAVGAISFIEGEKVGGDRKGSVDDRIFRR